jgi:hypothetical protein
MHQFLQFLILQLTIFLIVITNTPIHHVNAQPLKTFGTSISQQPIYAKDTLIFEYYLSGNAKWGTMTHFWCTGDPAMDTAIWSYYIDDDIEPSIQFASAMAAGTGFAAEFSNPWSTRWMGKAGANAQNINFRIPFYKSIRIFGRLDPTSKYKNTQATFWAIVRGTENLPVVFDGFQLPMDRHARLYLNKIENRTLDILEFVDLLSLPSGDGMLFAHTLQAESASINFLEGCYHAYSPSNTAWPGVIVSSGTEDAITSSFYDSIGLFHGDIAGFTYFITNVNLTQVSYYRLYDLDTIFFTDGFRFQWRNGDVYDGNGYKCILESGGTKVGNPLATTITSYVWYYTWDPETPKSTIAWF